MNIYSPVISGSLTITGSTTIIGSVTITSGSLISTASNAMALDGTGSLAFVTTASYNPTSASFSSILTSVSSSQQQISASLLQVSASYISLSGSYNTFSGSTSTRITTVSASQQDISASLLQVSASYISLSGSYNIFSGSASTRITTVSASQQDISASLLQVSASYIALSGSYNIFSGSASTRITTVSSSQQDISASLLNVIATYATTGSNSFRANQSITGSLVVSSTITAQTLVVQTVTSSIVYSSGSNNFGNQLANTQTFTGSVNITGSLALAGNITSNGTAVVLGSGTSNYLPKFTAASTIGNSLVVDNGTNIGIGTTNPTAGRLQINVSDTTTAAHFQIVDGTTTLADSFVTNFRNANDGDGRYSLSRWQVQNAVGNDQIGFIGVQSITGAGAYTPNIVFGQRTGVSTYATRMTLDSSGNLGLGVTPSAWSLGKGFDINGGMGLLSVSNASFVLNNAYYNGGWIYKASSFAQNFVLNNDGSFQFNIAPSGSANAAITFTQAMTLTAAGELLINTTSDAGDWKLQVNGSAYFTNTNSVGYTYVTIGNSGASGRSYDIGVGGNGVGSPYQNSFYVFDNVANQPRFYINSTGAATFRGDFTVFSSATGATTGDLLVDTSAKYVYVGRLSEASGDNTTFQVRDRTGTARATIPGGGSIDTVFSTNSSNFIVTNYSATALMTIANTGVATFSNRVIASNSAAGAATISTSNANSSDDAGMSNLNFDGNRLRLGVLPSDGAYGCIGASGAANTGLAFVTHNGAGWGERMRITPAGSVNINDTTNTTYKLAVTQTSGSPTTYFYNSATSGRVLYLQKKSADTGDYYIVCDNVTSNKFLVDGAGTIYAVNTTVQSVSDIRFKENIRDLETGLSEILSLKPRRFDWKEGKGMDIKNAIGFIAQEVEEILPDLVKDDWINSSTDSTSYKSLGMTNMIPTLVKAIQELKAEIELLKTK